MMISTNCGCSVTTGACDEHKVQNAIVASVAGAVSEADEVLAKAIESLGAVEVAPGRYAFQAKHTRNASELGPETYVIVDERNMQGYAFGWLCNEVIAVMPLWWTPTERFAWRTLIGGSIIRDALIGEEAKQYCERITASLETGEEVSA